MRSCERDDGDEAYICERLSDRENGDTMSLILVTSVRYDLVTSVLSIANKRNLLLSAKTSSSA
jgi:hypothetical protein